MASRTFYIMAHRGDQQHEIENTPEAFENLSRLIDNNKSSHDNYHLGVEFDIQLVNDQLVCYHDESFDRLHEKFKGKVLNVDDINEINSGNTYTHIPFFEDILKIFSQNHMQKFFLNIELKSFEITLGIKVVELVKKYNFEPRIILTSFYPPLIEYVSIHHPELQTGFLLDDVRALAKYAKNNSWVHKINYLIFNVKSLLDKNNKDLLKNYNNKLGVYTVDSKSYVTSAELFAVIKDFPELDLMMTDNMDDSIKNALSFSDKNSV
ncbi:MAG: glycerophosphodiester phosphodiesterase [Terrestrivirus sp.]|uniref:Glycerophosphodiester phosphodiesterase n=1 Tax=Terrestrivirus sp. TaxID=2487775 RepID=A0A3G4ZJX7_9VIRU|nr:MAG: glycerophosphodiester phosphodiesterase [Terrestrivirus sp.]